MSDLPSLDPDAWIALGELILKVVIAFVGGVYAFALLFFLRQRDQAQANIRRSEAEIRDLDLNRKHVEAQILDLELKTRQAVILVDIRVETYRDREAYIIIAAVELTNCGSQNARIIWKDQPPAFSVRMVRLNENRKTDYDLIGEFPVPLTLDPKGEALSHVVRAGGKVSLPFTARISSAGLYLLSFRGVVDEKDRAEAAKLGVKLPTAWTGNRYVFVDDARVANAGDNIRSDAAATLK